MKNIIIATVLFFSGSLFAQVSIGFPSDYVAKESLEINGAFKLHSDNELILENPGSYDGTSGNSILIVKNTKTNSLNKFDPANLPFASVTYVPYHFNNVSVKGLENYDTKIDAKKFYVTIGGFFVLTKDGGTSVLVEGSKEDFPLYSARAFVQNGTWRLKFNLNNREFSDQVDIYLNVSIYYMNFLTKVNEVRDVDMKKSETGSTKIPEGAISSK